MLFRFLAPASSGIRWRPVLFIGFVVTIILFPILFHGHLVDSERPFFDTDPSGTSALGGAKQAQAAEGSISHTFKGLTGVVSSKWGELVGKVSSKPPGPMNAPPDDEEYVAICMAVKDQPRDLPEFLIHHYHHLGIRRFYLMDDGSHPPLSTFEYGIPDEAITHVYFKPEEHKRGMQIHIYNTCHQDFGALHTWIAFIDADEYLEMTGNQTIVELLKELEEDPKIGALGVNWQIHTSGGLMTRPDSCRRGFTTCIFDDPGNADAHTDNKHIKSIVRTEFYGGYRNPHYAVLKNGTKIVGETGFSGPQVHVPFRSPITRDKISLHHYAVKSQEEYFEKMNRSTAMGHPKGLPFWNHIETGIEHISCPSMSTYWP